MPLLLLATNLRHPKRESPQGNLTASAPQLSWILVLPDHFHVADEALITTAEAAYCSMTFNEVYSNAVHWAGPPVRVHTRDPRLIKVACAYNVLAYRNLHVADEALTTAEAAYCSMTFNEVYSDAVHWAGPPVRVHTRDPRLIKVACAYNVLAHRNLHSIYVCFHVELIFSIHLLVS
jgi:hypothetical protein